MEYDDFSVRFQVDGSQAFQIGVSCARGEVNATFQPPILQESGTRLGEHLFTALMPPAVRTLYDETLAAADQPGRGVRLRLFFDRREARLAALSQLPWEQLYRPDRDQFLALELATPIVRHLAVPRPNALAPGAPPLRVLVAAPRVPGLPPLATAGEQDAITRLAGGAPRRLSVTSLARTNLEGLRQALREPVDIFHFIGHGAYDAASGEGCLVLERPGGAAAAAPSRDLRPGAPAPSDGGPWFGDRVRGEVLAHLLTGRRAPRLAVLNACETAVAGGTVALPAFGGVATALILGGVAAVVAMQHPISDGAACAFSAALYEGLAAGESLEEAVTEGRRAIFARRPRELEWSTPVLFLRLENGRLFPPHEPPEGGPARKVVRRAPAGSRPVVNRVEVDAATVEGPVDIQGQDGTANAGGGVNSVRTRLGSVRGPLSVSGSRSGRAEREDG